MSIVGQSIVGQVYKELVYGGHLLSIGTASIAASASLVLERTPTFDLLAMAYLFSLGAYTVNRISDFEMDRISHPDRTAYLERRKFSLPYLAFMCFAAGYALALVRNAYFFAGLLVPLALAIVYSVGSPSMNRILGFSRLKEGLLVKNVVVSFGWSLIPVLVGLYYLDIPVALLAFCPFIFLRLMVNTIFFDARDIAADEAAGVKTIPGTIGIKNAWLIMDVLDIAAMVMVVALAFGGVLPFYTASLAVFTPYSLAYRYYSLRSDLHKDSLRDLAADGEYLLWGFVASLGQI